MFSPEFFGSTVISDRGQVVIPNKARKALGLEKGDTLIVMGMNDQAIMLVKADSIEKMIAEMSEKTMMLGQMVKETKGQSNE
ncbi:MAG: AbrB/MazE/SpoVT family DNA-binding domain-containing protein [Coriobacteriia bacterium]|nr:AbrB/MazE/SpoVT family DNA-binding domain-containing protein [Coriobacteriia bacterium]